MPGACDHWLADDWELERIPAYIESNPVRVGSVDSAQIPNPNTNRSAPEERRDESRRGRHECPRHPRQYGRLLK